MFGYLRPFQDELKVKDARLYRAAYCGICRAISRQCGQLPRLALQYDAVLPALLWMALSPEGGRVEARRCIAQPLKAHPVLVGHPALDVAADVCLLLAHRKLKDDVADEHRLLASAGCMGLHTAVRRSEKRLGQPLVDEVDHWLSVLSGLEQARTDQLDAVADASGNMMRALFLAGPDIPDAARKALEWLAYQTGRWVYLADCIDDYDRDRKSGAYNVLLQTAFAREEAIVQAAEACDYAAAQAAAALDLLELNRYRDLLDNFYYAGMPNCLARLTTKKEQE